MNSFETSLVSLEEHFQVFRENIVGHDLTFTTPYGTRRLLYADWIASGRLYAPIEERMLHEIGPYVGNSHTETNVTGTSMTVAYHLAQNIIKEHVNARDTDAILTVGSGMTGAMAKFQRLLGLKVPAGTAQYVSYPEELRPVVFITHMEHHSNQVAWEESLAEVRIIRPDSRGLVDLGHLEELLEEYRDRKVKFASVTACSNVTGVQTPYHQIAAMMHRSGGRCFVDFACSAPYVRMDMHPQEPLEQLDAIFFSPHKFLGGPGTCGVLIFDSSLYHNLIPDQPGGGTVKWTNPWGARLYLDTIEEREDGGTPAILPTIRTALCIRLKEQMGIAEMAAREREILERVFAAFNDIPNLHILAGNVRDRIGAVSFYIDDLHYNLGVKMLNDRFGIQVRGGCACAGTYGHYLYDVSQDRSDSIICKISEGDYSHKIGWMRLSVHPVMSDQDVGTLIGAITELALNFPDWAKDYRRDSPLSNQFSHVSFPTEPHLRKIRGWFEF